MKIEIFDIMIDKLISVPNIITFFRIIGTVVIIFTKPFTILFYIFYSLCGLTDVLDGYIARKTNNTTDFGAKLDSVADVLYFIVICIKILLNTKMSACIWIGVGVIALIRFTSNIIVGIKNHSVSSNHSIPNKVCGLLVFFVPYVMLLSIRQIALYFIIAFAIVVALIDLIENYYLNVERTKEND